MIFDLGGTLVDWPAWDDDAPRRWGLAYDYVAAALPQTAWPGREPYVRAMRAAELAHWAHVDAEHWSGPPTGVLHDGFARLGQRVTEAELLGALDGYAHAVDGWAQPFPDARDVLVCLRERGYKLGLLSNTWWAAEWHNADLAAHGLAGLLDKLVYTSDLPHSKPHPFVFAEVCRRLGVPAAACVMVGDRLLDDIAGAQAAGLRAVWRENTSPFPRPAGITPTASIASLSSLPALLQQWGGA